MTAVDLAPFAALLALSALSSVHSAAVAALDRSDRQALAADKRGQAVIAQVDALGADAALMFASSALWLAASADLMYLSRGWMPLPGLVLVVASVAAIARASAQALGASFRLPIARALRPWMTALLALSWPARVVLSGGAVRLRGWYTRGDEAPADVREAEIRALVEQSTVAGSVDARERDIVEAVFEFGELTVGRLMTPRTELFAVSVDMGWEDLLERCRDASFSRVPVYGNALDDILGVLLLKDLLKYRSEAPDKPALRDLRAVFVAPTFVPQSKPAGAMLREFLTRNHHMAFVVDEHGTLVGLITLDDLLRELVGEILDQDDLPNEDSISVDRGGMFRVRAWMDLEDFHEETGIRIPPDGYHTLGGFVFHVLGRLPHKGDVVQSAGYRFIVLSMEGRRISELQVEPLDGPTAEEAP